MTAGGVLGYEIGELIGSGASARVYRARQLGSAGRTVALKRLAPTAHHDAAARLMREGQVLAALDHPHIVRIYELVTDGDAIAIAMQHAPGGSLADRLSGDGRLDAHDLVAVMAPIADALVSAHRNGILHRDVKPSNILFTSDGEPLLSDFGVARWLDAPSLTAAGMSLGTAGYIDPEIADGRQPDERSDVYSLGIVCYEALTGSRPFRGTNALALLRAADKGEFIPVRDADETVPFAVAAVVEQAMDRRPEARFASAAAFAAALRAAVGHAASRARPRAIETVPRPAAAEVQGGTRLFGPRPPAPPPPRHPRLRALSRAAAGLTIGVLVGGTALLGRTAGPVAADPPAAPRPPAPPPPAWSASVSGNVVELTKPGVEPLRFQLGLEGDVAVLGDWDCTGGPTAALYRPTTGEVFYFDRWAEVGEALTSSRSHSTGVRNGHPDVVADGGCETVRPTAGVPPSRSR